MKSFWFSWFDMDRWLENGHIFGFFKKEEDNDLTVVVRKRQAGRHTKPKKKVVPDNICFFCFLPITQKASKEYR
jgi:hypothetical protein